MHSKLKFGDLLYRRKGIAEHAGVYIGKNMVLHNHPPNGVTINSLAEFADGKKIKVNFTTSTNQSFLTQNLLEIIGNNDPYSLITNNCEHLTSLIIDGQKASPQIQSAIIGSFIWGLIGSQSKNCHWLIWLTGGALAGLLIANQLKQYDDAVIPIST